MIGYLADIRHKEIEGPELTAGDILGYQDGNHERYFVIRSLDLTRYVGELRIQELCSSLDYERNPSPNGNVNRYGEAFPYDLVSLKRNFTRVLPSADKLIKRNLCEVVVAAMFATDELRNLLVELEI